MRCTLNLLPGSLPPNASPSTSSFYNCPHLPHVQSVLLQMLETRVPADDDNRTVPGTGSHGEWPTRHQLQGARPRSRRRDDRGINVPGRCDGGGETGSRGECSGHLRAGGRGASGGTNVPAATSVCQSSEVCIKDMDIDVITLITELPYHTGLLVRETGTRETSINP